MTVVRTLGLVLCFSLMFGVSPSGSHPHDDCGCTSLRAVQMTIESEGIAVELVLDGAANHTEPVHLKNPSRLVVDLPGAISLVPSDKLEVGTEDLARIRIGQHRRKVRLVLDAGTSPASLSRARLLPTDRGLVFLIGNVTAPKMARVAAPAPPPAPVQQAAPAPPPAPLHPAAPAPVREVAPAPAQEAPPQMAAVRPSAAPPPPVPAGGDPLTYEGAMAWFNRYQDTQPSFNVGEVIRQADLEKLRPFLPPGYFEKLDFPELEVEIQETLDEKPHNSYTQASFQYGGQTGIAADGAITNYVAGRPFSDERILATTPEEAGLMIAWNNIYRWQHMGYRTMDVRMAYVTPGMGGRTKELDAALLGNGHVERTLVTQYHRVYLSHVATLEHQNYELDVRDAKSMHFKDWMQFTEPFDMRGMAFVFERFRDPRALDQVNSYLPTERRIRRLSAKERADAFVGSEMTLDDFEGFSGRVLDYEWKYLGLKHLLHVTDSRQTSHAKYFGPMSDVPFDHWQAREFYVIESRPLYEEHPYSRKLMFYDRQTSTIGMVLIFDREDRLLKVLYTIYDYPQGDPSGEPSETVALWRASVGVNLQTNRSSVNWGSDVTSPTMKASKVRRLFSVSNLTGGR